jgi:hypothetical protein
MLEEGVSFSLFRDKVKLWGVEVNERVEEVSSQENHYVGESEMKEVRKKNYTGQEGSE